MRLAYLIALAALTSAPAAWAQDQPEEPAPNDPVEPTPPAALEDDVEPIGPPQPDPPPPEPTPTPDPPAATRAEVTADADATAVAGAEPPTPIVPPDDGDRSWLAEAKLEPGLSLFAQYAVSLRDEAGATEWFHEFELPRAHASLTASYRAVRGRILMEAVRSASEGALLGVGGDSLVLRLREAYGEYTFFDVLEVRTGLVPTLSIKPLEDTWQARPIAASAIERTGLASPADLGATLRAHLPADYGWVGVGAFNGEGYRSRELNRGKNAEIGGELHPLASIEALRPLAVYAAYVSGSSGTGLAQANRIYGALLWQGTPIRGGASVAYAIGTEGDANRDALVFEAFARAEPIERLIFAGTFRYWNRDLSDSDDRILEGSGAVGYRLLPPIETFLAVDRTSLGETTELALPGEDQWRFRVVTDVTF